MPQTDYFGTLRVVYLGIQNQFGNLNLKFLFCKIGDCYDCGFAGLVICRIGDLLYWGFVELETSIIGDL